MINEYWKRLTLRTYLKYVKCYNEYREDPDLSFRLMGALENKDYLEIKNLPIGILQDIFKHWEFINEDFSKEEENAIVELDGESFFIRKDFGMLSMMQWQNLDEYLKLGGDNILEYLHMYIAIVIQDRENYSWENTNKYSELLLDRKMYYVIPNINFFLRDDETSSINTLLYSVAEEERKALENLMDTMDYSIGLVKNGVGMVWWRRWLTMIFLKLMRFYLKRSKIYSSTLHIWLIREQSKKINQKI
jgi:hypothetical protein